jgi:pyruvoyl-dependent arginine decarboxylase (PvlArgDC)
MATFSYCEKLTSVKLPSGLKGIGEYAFASCTSLTNIEFPSSLTDIQWYSFSGCTSLASIKIPAEVKSLGGWAFAGCTSLTSIKLPASMSGIGYATFMGCTGLTKIELPSSLIYMDYHAFSGCSNLTSIKIPANVSYIEVYAFENCDSLSSIIVDENNTVYDSRNGCNAIIETESNTLIQGCKNTKIPKGIVTVKEAAFQGCTGLTSIEIPEGVKNIEDSAFSGCTSLTNISMPRGVTNIGFHAFSHCESLKNIELLDGIEKIDSYAFYCCYNLESIMLPESLTSIGENAFENCSDLVIFSYENAYAHKYALENGIKWQKIERFDIQETAEVILDKTTYTYDGKAKTPSVTVKVGKNVLVAGKDYTVAYSNNKNVGIAIVTVTGMGNYTGVIKKEFKINPSVVKNFTYSARSSSAVALKWTKNTSAKGYVIEQYKGGKWIAIKTITSNATVSYKVTGLSASTANKFRIKAYKTVGNTKLYSVYTTKTVNTLPAGVKNFTYSARSSSAILLKWTKNTSASGYVIEQYKGGKWVAIKTITKNTTTSYKITGLKASTANKFRIKAYKSYGTTKLYSGYVSKSINTLPSGVAGFTYSARTNTTITLKWNKNTSATGYVIEQYKNGKWVKIKTVSKNSTVSYKVSGLKKATSYKFRIKAYKSYGSSKLYSGYVTKRIKTK